jgi:hypothetical protein
VAALSLAGLLTAGCSDASADAKLDAGFRRLFTPQRTPQQYMLIAVSSEDADARRDAVTQIARSKQSKAEWAIKGFVAIALLESDPQARCVAIRALARTGDPRAVETVLRILNHREYPPQEVWPPDALCRWDATEVLASLSAAGAVPEDQREKVRKTLLDRLRSDTDRHARIAAARGLGCCATEEVLKGLIDGLRDEDFAVVHECEGSLVRLTGETHDCNALAWEDWLEVNRETAFARAGQVPASRRPAYGNRWEKAAYDTHELFNWLWPGRKEE